MENAWIVYWSHDEEWVLIRPEGKNSTRTAWARVQREPGRLFCEYKGQRFHLQYV